MKMWNEEKMTEDFKMSNVTFVAAAIIMGSPWILMFATKILSFPTFLSTSPVLWPYKPAPRLPITATWFATIIVSFFVVWLTARKNPQWNVPKVRSFSPETIFYMLCLIFIVFVVCVYVANGIQYGLTAS